MTAGATVTFDGGGSAVALDPGLAMTAGTSTTLASATVTLTNGELSSDILSFHGGSNTETFSDGDKITATYSAGVLTLSGTATVADYQTALDQVQFGTTSNADPTNGGSDTNRTISWVVNDGTSNSTAATSTLDTVHVVPTVTAGAAVTFVSGGSAAVLDSGLSVADVDSGGDLTGATVKIGTGFVAGDDTLSFTNQSGITGTYNSGNGTLTLTGTATLAQYQAALEFDQVQHHQYLRWQPDHRLVGERRGVEFGPGNQHGCGGGRTERDRQRDGDLYRWQYHSGGDGSGPHHQRSRRRH